MSGKQTKLIRRQLMKAARASAPSVLAEESMKSILAKLEEKVQARLDSLSDAVTKEVTKIDTQTQDFRRMVFRDASEQLSRELANVNVTNLAWQQVLAEELGMTLDELEPKIAARKKILVEKLEAEAKAKLEAEAKAKAEADAAKAAEEAAKKAAEGSAESSTETAEADDAEVESAPAESAETAAQQSA